MVGIILFEIAGEWLRLMGEARERAEEEEQERWNQFLAEALSSEE